MLYLQSSGKEKAERKTGSDFTMPGFPCRKEEFLNLVDTLAEFDFPQFHVISGNDDGDVVTLYYHFTLFQVTGRGKRIRVNVSVPVDKISSCLRSFKDSRSGVQREKPGKCSASISTAFPIRLLSSCQRTGTKA